MLGYLHQRYAESFSAVGAARELLQCRGWILERRIPGSAYRDAMGCYPRFLCQDWSRLHIDLQDIGNELVCLSLVTDPFGDYTPSYLSNCFDLVRPFKEHYVVDLCKPKDLLGSKHHRRFARKGLARAQIELCSDPSQFINEWDDLWHHLVNRHHIRGIRAFSKPAFAKQLTVPGTVLFRATHQGKLIGLHWYYEHGEVVYAHLAALAPDCYQLATSYALHWCAIEHFTGRSHWLDLGAGAGVDTDGTDGLSEFKRGWSTGTRVSFFCGRVFAPREYLRIVTAAGIGATAYFPAYRDGEFG